MAVRGLLSHVVAAACGGILVFLALFNGCFPQGSERAEQIQGDPSQTLQRVNQPNCSVFVTELSILRADLAEKELALVHLQHRLNAMVTTAPLTPSPTTECKCSLPPGDDLDTLFKRRFKPKARFEVPDWEAFDPAYVFSSNRPAPRMNRMGATRLDTDEAIKSTQTHVGPKFTLLHGQIRFDPSLGMEYLIDVGRTEKNGTITELRRVHLLRPIAPALRIVGSPTPAKLAAKRIHIILAIAGRVAMFRSFLLELRRRVLDGGERDIHLTVVCFSQPQLQDEVQACTEISNELEHYHRHNGLKFRLVRRAERFSRGAGLEHGVQAVQASMHHSVLLFFADVDITFSPGFLFRCRANAVEGRRVYYPVVYSVFRNRSITVTQNNGLWRHTGYGMLCIHDVDFDELGGFNKSIVNWGGEDVDLYERTVKHPNLEVMRAIDDGIVHVWHDKECNGTVLTAAQYSSCLGTKAILEGSTVELGKMLGVYRAYFEQAGLSPPLNPGLETT